MFLKQIIPKLIVRERFTNNEDETDNQVNNSNKNSNLVSNIVNNLNKGKIDQEKVEMVSLIVWIISLVLVLTLGVWLWNNVLIELFPFINKVKNPLQILGLIVLLNMIF